jgi:hypothetical protein
MGVGQEKADALHPATCGTCAAKAKSAYLKKSCPYHYEKLANNISLVRMNK